MPHLTADFYSVTLEDVDWFSISFFVASLVVGFISIGILDIFGLRTAVSYCPFNYILLIVLTM